MTAIYLRGTPVSLVESFEIVDPLTKAATPADPTTVAFIVAYPDETEQTFEWPTSPAVSNPEVGTFVCKLDQLEPGEYRYRVAAAGDVIAVREDTFTIVESDVLDPTVGPFVPLGDTTPYCDMETLRSILNIKTADRSARLDGAATAATDAINSACDRDFHRPAELQVRYYTPDRPRTLQIDDVLQITELATDQAGLGQFTIVWQQNRDYTLEPLNALTRARPYERVKVHPLTRFLLVPRPRSVRVTGFFGWPDVPASVAKMCEILATKLYKRPDAPFGIASFGTEVAMQVLRTDPDYMLLLGDYLRDPIVYG